LFRTAPPAGGQPHPFDEEFGVDTAGFVSWREMQTGGSNDPYISGYLGIAPSVGRRVCAMVENPSEFVFIDIGSGKGRMLILASEVSFKRVIGVEIGAELAEAGRRNAEIIRSKFPGRPAIESLHADAALYEFPLEPLVVFMNQPFEVPVMRKLLANLESTISVAPRPVIVIYLYPTLAEVVDRSPLLERVGEGWFPLQKEEVPFAFGGRQGGDRFVVWGTKHPKPAVRLPKE
jgi:predicted RNA methylase